MKNFEKFYSGSKRRYGNYYRRAAIDGTSGERKARRAKREKQGATGAANRKVLRYFKKRGNKRGEWARATKERTLKR